MSVGFEIGHLDHIVLRVKDMDRALAFYSDVLGINEERRIETIGLVQLRAGTSLIDLIPMKPGENSGGRNMEHFCLTISPFNVDELTAHLETHGVEYGEIEERYGADGYGPSIYINDPDGNIVELKKTAV